MLTADQRDEFSKTGLLRLRAALPRATAETMCDRLWEFLADRDGIHRDERSTWTVEAPIGFQPLTHSGAFRAIGSDPLYATMDTLFGAGQWAHPRWWAGHW